MTVLFYIASAVAVVATLLVITRAHPVHALLYFIVSLLAVAVVFFLVGAGKPMMVFRRFTPLKCWK